MRPHAQAFLHVLTASAAFLRREARRNSDHLMISSLSLIFKDSEKRAPTRVVNALGQMMIPHHSYHIQVFDTNTAISLRILLGGLEMKVPALAADLEVLAGDFTARLASAVAAFLATTQRPLGMGQTLLPPAVVARILHHSTV